MGLLGKLGLASVPAGVVLDEMSLEPLAELDVGGCGGAVAAGLDDAVWFTTRDGRALSRIEPATRAEARRLELPAEPRQVTADARGPVVLCEGDVVLRASADGRRVEARAQLPDGVLDVVAAGGALWALRAAGSPPFDVSLLMLDVATLAPMREVPIGRSTYAGGLRTGDGVVCALVEGSQGSMRNAVLELETGALLPDERAPRARGIAERDGMRWVTDGDQGFKRLDIDSGRTLARGHAPGPHVGSAILAHGRLWACNFRRRRSGDPQHMY